MSFVLTTLRAWLRRGQGGSEPEPGDGPSLDFSQADNSQYIPIIAGLI